MGSVLGIDLGTSSVKILLRHGDGTIVKAKQAYREESPAGWWEAVVSALRELDLSSVTAVGLSSQTGTYIARAENGASMVLGWRDGSGKEELAAIREGYPRERFLSEIAMPHPPMVSYPIPRILHLKNRLGTLVSVCQPKDCIVYCLTGCLKTDVYTWRGLADPKTGKYSAYFLREIGIDESALPPLGRPTDLAGRVTESVADRTGLPVGTPVYLGMNDFFASIVGMGIVGDGMFDITGTSEHLGVVSGAIAADTPLVSGPYLDRFVSYGVTGSSGASLDFVRDALGDLPKGRNDPAEFLKNQPPIFLPYLRGERAPIFDADASGVFFGLSSGCTREDMAYAVCEGVAFSLYHIYETMGGADSADRVTVSGGASGLALLTKIKAELFGKTFVTLRETDTSALGAVLAACVGHGMYPSLASAAANCCAEDRVYAPTGKCREALLSRYAIYKRLYPALKSEMHAFRALSDL
jgi:sugar (pentulose or hexulose) kinase